MTASHVADEKSHSALVLFSGGQDSATILPWALERYDYVRTIGFDYGQNHQVELACRLNIRELLASSFPQWASHLGGDDIISLPQLSQLSHTSLTRENVTQSATHPELPSSFVPGRNLIFMLYAAIVAARYGVRHLVTGVCETDYSGYPDCRDDTMKALQVALNLGMNESFIIDTPLMWLTKAQTWALAYKLGGDKLVSVINKESHSCYKGERGHYHPWGYGCGTCPACQLRKKGWDEWRRHHHD